MNSHISHLLEWGMAVLAFVMARGALYNKAYPTGSTESLPFDFHVVQIDDYGTFWDADAADDVLQRITHLADQENVMVVLFIHGWHHNAARRDQNLRSFKQTLRELNRELHQPSRSNMRGTLTSSENVRLIGIYLGWRGRSLPGWLDYATVWPRKSAAERVGDGDASEFIERLDRIYLRRNAALVSRQNNRHLPLMGLVTIGHSLGGQVLLRALGRSLEYALAKRAPHTADTLNPTTLRRDRKPAHAAVGSLGDLNIILNPATEAYQFARIDALYRQLQYPRTQTPQLVVFSADDDKPRRFLFPLARIVTRPFRAPFRSCNDNYQSALWKTALGAFPKQQTHDLNPTNTADSLSSSDFDVARQGQKIMAFDFTGDGKNDDVVFAGVCLKPVAAPVAGGPGRIPYSPVAVAVTHQDIIKGHDGIFGQQFIGFLVKYIGYIEGKRMLLRAKRRIDLRS
jgi:hypothetical protein